MNEDTQTFLEIKDYLRPLTVQRNFLETDWKGVHTVNDWYQPLSIKFKIDNQLDLITVEGYSIIELLADIGGVGCFLYAFFWFFAM